MPEKDEKQRTAEFLAKACERFKQAAEAESQIRRESLDDLRFSIGEQWPGLIKASRQLDKRPCLTINRLPQFFRQVTNEQRQARPAIQINPVGDGATIETAETLQGIVRHIERNSEAEIGYDHAFEMMVRIGFGYFRVVTDYVQDGSFEQEIQIKRIKNPFTVYFDPNCSDPDYSDAKWAFVIEDVPRETFKEQFPHSEAATLAEFASVGDRAPGWLSKETVRIAEYFYVTEERKTLYQLDDGRKVFSLPEGAMAVSEREQVVRRVNWAKITALDILDENIWPGRWIPIIPVLGDDMDVDGKRHLSGLVRNAKDAQRMSNYWKSAATEVIALAPRNPHVGVEGQFEGHEEKWREANVRNYAYLEYKAVSVSGQPAPRPQRQTFEPPIQAMVMMIRDADNDLKATTGIYDASLGESGPETSGKAILARQKQSDVANLNYSDNMARSIRFAGKIILDLIPKIYDVPRIQRIVNPDNSVKYVVIHRGAEQAQAAQGMLSDSVKRIFDIGVGRYDVTVSVGASYQSKRMEAATSMIEFIKAFPQSGAVIADLLAKNMDWPGSQQIADRLKKMLPPNLQEGEDGDPRMELQKAKAQLQALSQQHELLTKALQESTEVIKTKKMELESKERIAAMDNQTKLALAEAQAQREGALELLRAQMTAITNRLDLLGQDRPVEAQTQ